LEVEAGGPVDRAGLVSFQKPARGRAEPPGETNAKPADNTGGHLASIAAQAAGVPERRAELAVTGPVPIRERKVGVAEHGLETLFESQQEQPMPRQEDRATVRSVAAPTLRGQLHGHVVPQHEQVPPTQHGTAVAAHLPIRNLRSQRVVDLERRYTRGGIGELNATGDERVAVAGDGHDISPCAHLSGPHHGDRGCGDRGRAAARRSAAVAHPRRAARRSP
jgi:hypothetical protein